MPAYIIVDIDIHDALGYEEYKRVATATLALYNGKFVVRGAPVQVIEGYWKPSRLVIIEFPSKDKAMEWWDSPEYAQAKEIRYRTANANMILVEGYEE